MSPGIAPAPNRQAGSRPFPDKPPGTVDDTMPFDHLVVVMMENHSFDNLLGALPQTNPLVDGLTFNAGVATNSNPGTSHTPAEVQAFPLPDLTQAKSISQSWRATREQIDGGLMDGFVRSSARLSRWGTTRTSCCRSPTRSPAPSPSPTAGSALFRVRLIRTAVSCWPAPRSAAPTTSPETLLDPPPPHGTIFDHLSAQHISWCDYFTDVPMTAVIPSIILNHTGNHAPISKFFDDCQAGTLPSVSFLDPGVGAVSSIVSGLDRSRSRSRRSLQILGANFSDGTPAETEEDPQNMYYGEAWAHSIVEAILQSPKWQSNAAHLHLRRARRLLRPRPTPRGTPAGQHPAKPAARGPQGRLRHLRAAGPGDHRLPLLKARRGQQSHLRPHVHPRDDRA